MSNYQEQVKLEVERILDSNFAFLQMIERLVYSDRDPIGYNFLNNVHSYADNQKLFIAGREMARLSELPRYWQHLCVDIFLAFASKLGAFNSHQNISISQPPELVTVSRENRSDIFFSYRLEDKGGVEMDSWLACDGTHLLALSSIGGDYSVLIEELSTGSPIEPIASLVIDVEKTKEGSCLESACLYRTRKTDPNSTFATPQGINTLLSDFFPDFDFYL